VRQTDIWSVGCTLLEMLTAHEAKELKIAQEARRSENNGAYTNSERLPARKSKKRTGGERGPSWGGEGEVGEEREGEVGGQREGGRHQESTQVARRSREKGKESPEEGHATPTEEVEERERQRQRQREVEEVEEEKEVGHAPPTEEGGAARSDVHLNGHALRYCEPPIPDALPAKTKAFVRACLQQDARKRPSAIKLLEHPFLQV